MNIRLMEWNVAWLCGAWPARRAAIHQVLTSYAPQLVCVVEAMDLELWNDASSNESLHWVFSEAEKVAGQALGVALGSALPIVATRTWATKVSGGAQRSGIAAVVSLALSGCMIVAVAHLSWQRDGTESRRNELRRLLDEIAELQRDHPTAPVAIAGDFNAFPTGDEMSVLSSAGFKVVSFAASRDDGGHFIETRPYSRWVAAKSAGSCTGSVAPEVFGAIDHCWIRSSSSLAVGVTRAAAAMDDEANSSPLSDHRPLIIDLALTPRRPREFSPQEC